MSTVWPCNIFMTALQNAVQAAQLPLMLMLPSAVSCLVADTDVECVLKMKILCGIKKP